VRAGSQHFGGSGDVAEFDADDTSIIEPGTFPTAKVVGGMDFVGDAYTGGNTPQPDLDPLDCNGHGSHVGGSAAGLGVGDIICLRVQIDRFTGRKTARHAPEKPDCDLSSNTTK
jgi:hypothetical protein